MQELCEGFAEMSKLQKIEMRFPKDKEKFDLIQVFRQVAKLAKGKEKPLEVTVSNYYTRWSIKEI